MKVVCLLLALFALAAADPYYIPNTDEYFDRPAESLDDLERMGIDTASLHPDIAEDARLLVVSTVKRKFNIHKLIKQLSASFSCEIWFQR